MDRKMIEEKFLNKSKFTEIVEETVTEKQLSYMDSVSIKISNGYALLQKIY